MVHHLELSSASRKEVSTDVAPEWFSVKWLRINGFISHEQEDCRWETTCCVLHIPQSHPAFMAHKTVIMIDIESKSRVPSTILVPRKVAYIWPYAVYPRQNFRVVVWLGLVWFGWGMYQLLDSAQLHSDLQMKHFLFLLSFSHEILL